MASNCCAFCAKDLRALDVKRAAIKPVEETKSTPHVTSSEGLVLSSFLISKETYTTALRETQRNASGHTHVQHHKQPASAAPGVVHTSERFADTSEIQLTHHSTQRRQRNTQVHGHTHGGVNSFSFSARVRPRMKELCETWRDVHIESKKKNGGGNHATTVANEHKKSVNPTPPGRQIFEPQPPAACWPD